MSTDARVLGAAFLTAAASRATEIGGRARHPATIVRVRNGKLSTTDGPFVETKEQRGTHILQA